MQEMCKMLNQEVGKSRLVSKVLYLYSSVLLTVYTQEQLHEVSKHTLQLKTAEEQKKRPKNLL